MGRSGSEGGEVRESGWGDQEIWVRRSGSVGEEISGEKMAGGLCKIAYALNICL